MKKDKVMGIYKITSPSGRVYVGQSVDIKTRWNCYYRLKAVNQIKLINSLSKYGVDKHIFEVIEECPMNLLDDREEYWGMYYEVLTKGLNSALRMSRQIFSQETRDKIKAKRKLQVHSEETKRKIGEKSKGRIKTEEELEKISQSLKGIKRPTKGVKLSEEMYHARFKNQFKPIIQMSLDGEFIKLHNSFADANRYLGKDPRNTAINSSFRKKFKTCFKYKWQYAK